MTVEVRGYSFKVAVPDVNAPRGKKQRLLLVVASDIKLASEIAHSMVADPIFEGTGPEVLALARSIGVDGQDLHILAHIGQSGVADGVAILRHMRGNREDGLGKIQVGAPLAALVADAEHALAHEFLETVPRLDGPDMHRLVGPLSREAQLAPSGDRRPAAMARGREQRIDLRVGEMAEGVVRVDKESDGVEETEAYSSPPAAG